MTKYKLYLGIYLLLHVFFSSEGSLSVCTDIIRDKMFGLEDTPTNISTQTEEICRGRCKAENTCNAWSWNKGTTMCFLFETKSEKTLPGFISGEKNCKGDAFHLIFICSAYILLCIVLVDLLQCKNRQSTKKVFGSKRNSSVDVPAVSLHSIGGLLIG